MEKKEKQRLGVVFILVLLLGFYMDLSGGAIMEDGTISRDVIGGENQSVTLVVNAEEILEEYVYELDVEPARVTKEEANTYFQETIEIIQKDFEEIGDTVPMEESYISDLVEAEWMLEPYGFCEEDGTIIQGEIPKEGLLVNAQVTLTCGAYEQVYGFPFKVEKKATTQKEQIISAITEWMEVQMQQEGVSQIQLPTELDGMTLTWSEKKEHLTLKILLLEIAAVVLIIVAKAKKKEQDNVKRQMDMELDYPEVVSQLSILLGAGMTLRQGWNKIAVRYSEKKDKGIIAERPAFEEILYMNRRLSEGESERIAYQHFEEQVNVMCYHRLMRILLGNLEKGTKGICELLEEESRQAYEQRILLAKKMGEEASTKMLIPLMLMMVLVMAIVILPAIISFSL